MRFIIKRQSSHCYTIHLRKPYLLFAYSFLYHGVQIVLIEKSVFSFLVLRRTSFPSIIRKWIAK